MNKVFNLALVGAALVSSYAGAYEWGDKFQALPEAPDGFKWVLNPQFTDEFDTWDSNKWQAKHDWWDGSGKGRPGAYVEGDTAEDTPNVEIKNSKLFLYAKANGPSEKKWVGTSVVASKERLSYGYYEVKMRASQLATTSSFWMQGKYSEIDVIEAIGRPQGGHADSFSTKLHSNYHYFPNGFGKPGYAQGPSANKSGIPGGVADSWHTYGIWWKNNKEAYIYLDGKRVTDFSYWNADGKTWDKLSFPAEFNEPMVMFFDTEIWNWGNGSPGTPSKAELETTDGSNAMQVEWVRAYQLVPVE
ncbi:family 16 glycosylhydrolase [Gayadomonas joobiniege]|uniref:family 16 glycosylhydrolase n=1 Tax=Gayadomonas joobiniege TaxID=1234606 RepID=UPI00035C48B7|nr:family 16 glycosylhydrolase [Gayadomonas joobiniege]